MEKDTEYQDCVNGNSEVANKLVADSETTTKPRNVSIREKLKDPAYKKRVLHSFFFSLSSLTLGFVVGQQGPTFLDLLIITDTSVETASALYTVGSCGYMVGSFLSGALHRKINPNILLFVVTAGSGVASAIIPYCSLFWLMMVTKFITHVFLGGIDTLVNAEHMRIWGNDGPALLQMIHFTFAFGGMLTPLYTEPFLAAKREEEGGDSPADHLALNMTSGLFPNVTGAPFNNQTLDLNMTTQSTFGLDRTTNVHYAFLITGILSVISSLPFAIMIFTDKSTECSAEQSEQRTNSRKLPLPLYIFMIALLLAFYFVYCCVEDTFNSFLMTFVVREFDEVTKPKGAYITTCYWASFAFGRFASIFVARKLSAVRIIYLYSFLMIVAYTGFYITSSVGNIDGLTFFAALAGIAMSAVFPAGISYTEAELFNVTGWISSFILIGSSIGMMTTPIILGYLMEEVTNMWFCYILLGASLLLCFVFAFILLFNRCFVNKRYGPMHVIAPLEIDISVNNETSAEDGEKLSMM